MNVFNGYASFFFGYNSLASFRLSDLKNAAGLVLILLTKG